MIIKFNATSCHYDTNLDEGIQVMGLSNGEFEYDSYVLFQRALHFDKTDIELGMNTYYFEVNGQEYSGYGACKKVTLDKDTLRISVDSQKIHNIESIEVDISDVTLDNNFIDNFKQILKDKVEFQILA